MLPVGKALIGYLAHSGVIGSNVLLVVGRQPISSALPDIESSGLFVYTGVSAPGSLPGTTASRLRLRLRRGTLLTRVSSKTTA